MRGSEIFHRALSRHGVDHIFGIMGREAEVLPRRDRDAVRWVLVRHEFTAGVAAEVYARLTGRPQVAFSTFGPGATNLATGVASAFLDRSPLLAVSAQVERDRRLFGRTHQCIDQLSLMRPITKYAVELEDARELPGRVAEALETALEEPRGPAYLSIPLDLFRQDVPNAEGERLLASSRRAVGAAPAEPRPEALKEALALLAASRRPVAVAGNEVIRAGAGAALAAFCERHRVPVALSLASKGVLPEGHPFNLGPINRYLDGILRMDAVAKIFDPADLVVLIGWDLAEDVEPGLWSGGGRKRVLRIGLTKNAAGPKDWAAGAFLRPDAEVVGGLRRCLSRLASGGRFPTANGGGNSSSPYGSVAGLAAELCAARRSARLGSGAGRLDPCAVVRETRAALGPDGILVADVGVHKHLAGLLTDTDRPNTFLCSNGLGTFGFGLPAALGAALACPGRPVAAVVGDGGFHSNSQDMETLARLRLPVVIVVLADSSFGLIKHYQKLGGRRPEGDVTDFLPVDFPKLAQANGCRGVRVRSEAGFARALRTALAAARPKSWAAGPTLIEVPVAYH